MRRYARRDDHWDRIQDFRPGREGHVGAQRRPTTDCSSKRFCIDFEPGIPWRDLPERFGDWKIVHQRFGRWAKSGVFDRVFTLLASDHDNEYMMIDATIVAALTSIAAKRTKKTANKRSVDPQRRTDHQNPCARRCPWQPRCVEAHARPGSRSGQRRGRCLTMSRSRRR